MHSPIWRPCSFLSGQLPLMRLPTSTLPRLVTLPTTCLQLRQLSLRLDAIDDIPDPKELTEIVSRSGEVSSVRRGTTAICYKHQCLPGIRVMAILMWCKDILDPAGPVQEFQNAARFLVLHVLVPGEP